MARSAMMHRTESDFVSVAIEVIYLFLTYNLIRDVLQRPLRAMDAY